MNVVRLVDARDPARFGAKAATLSALAAEHRVPEGFAVAADASDDDVRALVPAAYAALGGDAAVAVRSSAIGEDSRDASFAGQHETILNVRGADALVEAALAVRASATSERASAYRKEKGIAGIPRVGLLVQRMVPATASVIAFTADPVTGDRDLVVVNACRGLGDAMASGEVTPDAWRVRKGDLEIAFASASVDGAALTHAQVQQVARIAIALEREAGHPVDIEAAFEHDALYLLQSRPVTAAGTREEDFPIAWRDPADAEITWRREDAHHGVVSRPLCVDYPRYGAAVGIQRRMDQWKLPIRFRLEEFNGRLYVSTRTLARDSEMPAHQERASVLRRAHSRALARDWTETHHPEVRRLLAEVRALDPGPLGPNEAGDAFERLFALVSDIWTIHMLITGGGYPLMDELATTYERLTGRPSVEAFALVRGLAHTLQQLRRDLFALYEATRALPHVARAIGEGVDRPDLLRHLPGGDRFTSALERFLERHGDVGQPNDELDAPAWRDDPRQLVREIRGALDAAPADPDVHLRAVIAEGEATARRAREILADRPDDLAAFDEVYAVARVVGPLTEEHNYWIDRQAQAEVRRAVLRFGARMVRDGTIAMADQVFWCYVPEAADALRRPRGMRAFVAERERRHARDLRLRAPITIGRPPAAGRLPGLGAVPSSRTDLLHVVAQDEAGVLKGVAACAGVATGPARLVRVAEDLRRVRPGDVLVCHSSNVSYVPVFGRVAAVVTEVGGALSHAAVVAREVGVPCVVATGLALTELRDGEIVEVDGGAGVVRRVAAPVEVA